MTGNVFLDGQQNLAALSVPGVYGDIIPPNPFLVGTPTNIEGLVGVASWGPTNVPIPIGGPSDGAIKIGTPLIRTYDIATHIAAGSKVGSAIGWQAVRVTDGTDVAATASITSGALTITAKYTGILGNNIRVSFQQGALAYSLMAVIAFPGLQPEQINNVLGPVAATGTATFSGQPSANDTLTVGGTAITFVSGAPSGNQVQIGGSLAVTLASLLSFLQASADTNLVKFNYALTASNVLTFTANQYVNGGTSAGTGGNALTLAKVSTNIVLSGATLAGGTGTWQTFWTNVAAAINNGNAFSGASRSVVATAGVSTAAPTLSSPVTLSGGTDGASGVTDATLVGQDVVPRKGMYALRSSGVDCFTLIDLTTIANYANIAAFALSETCYAHQSMPSGSSIASAIAARQNAGIDSSWFKLITGDWTYFFDDVNSVERLVNPTAFSVGIYGNLSPQNSALNKPLQGVTATQSSKLLATYAEPDLSLVNLNGIDLVLPSYQSPGGFYFSFASARNASSNTAANGDEYTRMTNFLIRTAQSKAAGSFVGKLQSIQANDQTRNQAKALFDGLSQQLASPAVGNGLNGQCMIDGWSVICDLTNNSPTTIAQGYLFLYWAVRYLAVVRYFVVKFQGGSNVNVSVQTSVPNISQFAPSINTANPTS